MLFVLAQQGARGNQDLSDMRVKSDDRSQLIRNAGILLAQWALQVASRLKPSTAKNKVFIIKKRLS